jgi:signal transduction histidine kinase
VVGAEVVLTVADRGPGVPDSARRRIFDPFFSTKSRGTGLGLAVSKQIIDEHNGRIRLLPRRGGGTRVVIELPVG